MLEKIGTSKNLMLIWVVFVIHSIPMVTLRLTGMCRAEYLVDLSFMLFVFATMVVTISYLMVKLRARSILFFIAPILYLIADAIENTQALMNKECVILDGTVTKIKFTFVFITVGIAAGLFLFHWKRGTSDEM